MHHFKDISHRALNADAFSPERLGHHDAQAAIRFLSSTLAKRMANAPLMRKDFKDAVQNFETIKAKLHFKTRAQAAQIKDRLVLRLEFPFLYTNPRFRDKTYIVQHAMHWDIRAKSIHQISRSLPICVDTSHLDARMARRGKETERLLDYNAPYYGAMSDLAVAMSLILQEQAPNGLITGHQSVVMPARWGLMNGYVRPALNREFTLCRSFMVAEKVKTELAPKVKRKAVKLANQPHGGLINSNNAICIESFINPNSWGGNYVRLHHKLRNWFFDDRTYDALREVSRAYILSDRDRLNGAMGNQRIELLREIMKSDDWKNLRLPARYRGEKSNADALDVLSDKLPSSKARSLLSSSPQGQEISAQLDNFMNSPKL